MTTISIPIPLPPDFAETFSAATASGQNIKLSVDVSYTPEQMATLLAGTRLNDERFEKFAAGVKQAAYQVVTDDRRAFREKYGLLMSRAAETIEQLQGQGRQSEVEILSALNTSLKEATAALKAAPGEAPDTRPINVHVSVPPGSINLRATMATPDTETETTVEQDKQTGRIMKTRARTRAIAPIGA